MILSPITELEAVNVMLDYLGDPPVNSLEEVEGSEAARAFAILRETQRRFQTEPYSFNTERLTLVPESNGYLVLPANTLVCLPDDNRYIQRGSRLYDLQEHTDIIPHPLSVRIIRALSFEDLPESARYLITLLASKKFVGRAIGDGNLLTIVSEDLFSAQRSFLDYELLQSQPNLFSPLDQERIRRESSPHDRGVLCR